MNQQPDFIEFAAIQIMSSLVSDPRRGTSFEEDALEAWRLAKVLYDAKPEPADQGIMPQIDIIAKKMQKDSDLVWVWHSNIAMAFVDEGGDREFAIKAADRIMEILFNVDTSKCD
jgi:hypothetical protein